MVERHGGYYIFSPGKGNRERMREKQHSKRKWWKTLSRIKDIFDFSDLKYTHNTEINKQTNSYPETDLIFYMSSTERKKVQVTR